MEIPNLSSWKLEFEESAHEYHLLTGSRNGVRRVPVDSVTTLVSKVYPFDAGRVSYFVSQREGTTVEDVLARWDDRAVDGTAFHKSLEVLLSRSFRGAPVSGIHWILRDLYPDVVSVLLRSYDFEHLEYRVFVPPTATTIGLAGTIDAVAVQKGTGKRYLIDWKTLRSNTLRGVNKGITLGSLSVDGAMRAKADRHGLKLKSNRLARYELQLQLYRYLMLVGQYTDRIDGLCVVIFPVFPTVVGEKVEGPGVFQVSFDLWDLGAISSVFFSTS